MFNIARQELYRLFLSPLAWVILTLSQFLLAYLFLSHVDFFTASQSQISAIPGAPGVTELVAIPLLSNTTMIILLLTPLLTMRSLAEERRNETMPLLLSAPLSLSQVVLGKYLGYLAFFCLIALLALLMPLSLSIATTLDFYLLSAGFFGLILMVASFVAIGLYLSSLTKNPTVAAIGTFSLLFFLWIVDWAGDAGLNALSWFSLLRHFEPMLQGQINTMDIVFYLILIISFLLLTVRKLDSERLN